MSGVDAHDAAIHLDRFRVRLTKWVLAGVVPPLEEAVFTRSNHKGRTSSEDMAVDYHVATVIFGRDAHTWFSEPWTREEKRKIALLAGPHGFAVYKMILIQRGYDVS